jgi:hypothetical protein
VQVDPEPGGRPGLQALGKERADDPGQDITGAAAGEGGVLERRDRDRAIGLRR